MMKKIIVITIILAIFAVSLAFKANKKQVKYLTEQERKEQERKEQERKKQEKIIDEIIEEVGW